VALTNESYRTWSPFALVLTGFVVCVFWYRWNRSAANRRAICHPARGRYRAGEQMWRDLCVRSAARVDSILQGEPTLEMTLPAPPGISEEEMKKGVEPLHRESLQDFLALLKTNPCGTWKTVRRDYAADQALLNELKSQVSGC